MRQGGFKELASNAGSVSLRVDEQHPDVPAFQTRFILLCKMHGCTVQALEGFTKKVKKLPHFLLAV